MPPSPRAGPYSENSSCVHEEDAHVYDSVPPVCSYQEQHAPHRRCVSVSQCTRSHCSVNHVSPRLAVRKPPLYLPQNVLSTLTSDVTVTSCGLGFLHRSVSLQRTTQLRGNGTRTALEHMLLISRELMTPAANSSIAPPPPSPPGCIIT